MEKYVREKMRRAVSKDYVRERREFNLRDLAPDAAHPGRRFDRAFNWFRAAAVYAKRRTYRSEAIREAGLARRERILADAALMLQEHACRIDAIIPVPPRRRISRADYRSGYGNASTMPERMEAARAWFTLMAAQIERCQDNAAARDAAAAVKDEAAARLIEWAEEMDADDYGE